MSVTKSTKVPLVFMAAFAGLVSGCGDAHTSDIPLAVSLDRVTSIDSGLDGREVVTGGYVMPLRAGTAQVEGPYRLYPSRESFASLLWDETLVLGFTGEFDLESCNGHFVLVRGDIDLSQGRALLRDMEVLGEVTSVPTVWEDSAVDRDAMLRTIEALASSQSDPRHTPDIALSDGGCIKIK